MKQDHKAAIEELSFERGKKLLVYNLNLNYENFPQHIFNLSSISTCFWTHSIARIFLRQFLSVVFYLTFLHTPSISLHISPIICLLPYTGSLEKCTSKGGEKELTSISVNNSES